MGIVNMGSWLWQHLQIFRNFKENLKYTKAKIS